MGGPVGDGLGEFGDASEGSAVEAFVGEFFEPPFGQIQPGAGGRGVVQVPAAAVLVGKPFGDLGGGVR